MAPVMESPGVLRAVGSSFLFDSFSCLCSESYLIGEKIASFFRLFPVAEKSQKGSDWLAWVLIQPLWPKDGVLSGQLRLLCSPHVTTGEMGASTGASNPRSSLTRCVTLGESLNPPEPLGTTEGLQRVGEGREGAPGRRTEMGLIVEVPGAVRC